MFPFQFNEALQNVFHIHTHALSVILKAIQRQADVKPGISMKRKKNEHQLK